MAKRELIDSGSSKGYVRRTESGRFASVVDAKAHPEAPVKKNLKSGKSGGYYFRTVTGQFISDQSGKAGKADLSSGVRFFYSMPNGEKIVTVRRDIVDRALGRKK